MLLCIILVALALVSICSHSWYIMFDTSYDYIDVYLSIYSFTGTPYTGDNINSHAFSKLYSLHD